MLRVCVGARILFTVTLINEHGIHECRVDKAAKKRVAADIWPFSVIFMISMNNRLW